MVSDHVSSTVLGTNPATISCEVTGIIESEVIYWSGGDISNNITVSTGEYTIEQGNYGNNSQISTMTISAAKLNSLYSGTSNPASFSCKIKVGVSDHEISSSAYHLKIKIPGNTILLLIY